MKIHGTLNITLRVPIILVLLEWFRLSQRYAVRVKFDSSRVILCAAFLMGANYFAIDSKDVLSFFLVFPKRTAHLCLEASGEEMPEWICILSELLKFGI